MLAICLTLVVVMLLPAINLVSFSVNSRRKEICIPSALGASSWDITKIFLMETLVMSLFIFAFEGVLLLTLIFNAVFGNSYKAAYTLSLFAVDIYAILTLLGVCFIVLPLFTLLPTIRIARLKPIDAIRAL